MEFTRSMDRDLDSVQKEDEQKEVKYSRLRQELERMLSPGWKVQIATWVQPLDMHLVNVGSIPTGPTHGEGRLQPHPGDVA